MSNEEFKQQQTELLEIMKIYVSGLENAINAMDDLSEEESSLNFNDVYAEYVARMKMWGDKYNKSDKNVNIFKKAEL